MSLPLNVAPTPAASSRAAGAATRRAGRPQRATNAEIVAAYQRTGSVWRAGKELGIGGQSVHERLVALQYPMASRKWTAEEIEELRQLAAAGVTIGEVARRLGRTYAGIACKASELSFTFRQDREKKLPRGAGLDKATVGRHLKALESYAGSMRQFCRANGLDIELIVQAIQRHYPERWTNYVEQRSSMPRRGCGYCQTEFIPMSGKQQYCTRKCAADARADRSYFGGKRRQTVGLAQGICQLCGRHGAKGLSSHHVLGKENDPENELLVALCQGCHKAVTFLASRKFVDEPVAWEALISLAWLRRHGEEIAADDSPAKDWTVLHVTVDIETYVDEEVIDETPRVRVAVSPIEPGQE